MTRDVEQSPGIRIEYYSILFQPLDPEHSTINIQDYILTHITADKKLCLKKL